MGRDCADPYGPLCQACSMLHRPAAKPPSPAQIRGITRGMSPGAAQACVSSCFVTLLQPAPALVRLARLPHVRCNSQTQHELAVPYSMRPPLRPHTAPILPCAPVITPSPCKQPSCSPAPTCRACSARTQHPALTSQNGAAIQLTGRNYFWLAFR